MTSGRCLAQPSSSPYFLGANSASELWVIAELKFLGSVFTTLSWNHLPTSLLKKESPGVYDKPSSEEDP